MPPARARDPYVTPIRRLESAGDGMQGRIDNRKQLGVRSIGEEKRERKGKKGRQCNYENNRMEGELVV
jgi:hypothetical protein